MERKKYSVKKQKKTKNTIINIFVFHIIRPNVVIYITDLLDDQVMTGSMLLETNRNVI